MGLFSGGNTTTQTQVQEPWAPTQPYLQQGMKWAENLRKNPAVNFSAPKFNTYVPFSGQTNQALRGIEGIAGQGNPLAGQSMDAVSGILGGQTNDRYNQMFEQSGNPYFQNVLNQQSGALTDDISAQFGDMGRYGSASHTGAIADQVGDFRNRMASDNWNQNIANQRGILGDMTNAQLGAVAAAPGAYDQQYAPMERLAQVGATREDLNQRKMQSELEKFQQNQQAPWQKLNAYNSAITGVGGQGGTTTSAVQQPTNFLQGVGGLLGGAGLLKKLLGGGGLLGGGV